MAAMAAAFFITGCGCGTAMAKMAGRHGEEVEKKQRRSREEVAAAATC